MRRAVYYILILAVVASVTIVSARAAECRRVNGPYGQYGDLWCKEGGNQKARASTRKRAKQIRVHRAEKKHRAERKKSRSKVTKKVDTTTKSKTAESESPAEKAAESQNSSIARAPAETEEETSEQTALESDTKPVIGAITPTSSATCKKYIPTVETVSRPCRKGEADSGTCKQYIPTVETVSAPCE